MELTTRAEARAHAQRLVDKWMTGAALTGWIPGSTLFLAGADMVMIRQVAECYALPGFDESAVKAHLAGLVGGVVGGSVAAEVLGAVPVIGWFGKSAAMAGKAKIIGDAVINYFEERSPLPA